MSGVCVCVCVWRGACAILFPLCLKEAVAWWGGLWCPLSQGQIFSPSHIHHHPSLCFLTRVTKARSILLYLTHPLLPARVPLAAEASWMLDVLAGHSESQLSPLTLGDSWTVLCHSHRLGKSSDSSHPSPNSGRVTANCRLGMVERGQTLQDFGSQAVFLALLAENNLI